MPWKDFSTIELEDFRDSLRIAASSIVVQCTDGKTVTLKIDENIIIGVQDPMIKNIQLEENRFGVNVTIEKTAGANKDYDFEAVYKI